MKYTIVWGSGSAQEPERITPSETRELYQKAFNIINRKLFNSELPYIKIDFFEDPAEAKEEYPDALALFGFLKKTGEPIIVLDLQGTPEWGVNIDTISDLFHEMAHYYCYLHEIKDTDGDDHNYHNLAFKKVIEEHGGKCSYMDDSTGYSDTELSKKTLLEIFDEI